MAGLTLFCSRSCSRARHPSRPSVRIRRRVSAWLTTRPRSARIERPPIAQLAEAADLKSAQSGFESLWGDENWSLLPQNCAEVGAFFVARERAPTGVRTALGQHGIRGHERLSVRERTILRLTRPAPIWLDADTWAIMRNATDHPTAIVTRITDTGGEARFLVLKWNQWFCEPGFVVASSRAPGTRRRVTSMFQNASGSSVASSTYANATVMPRIFVSAFASPAPYR